MTIMTKEKVKGLGFLRGGNDHTENFFSAIPFNKNFTIGSSSECDLVIKATYIKDRHCVITSRIVDGNVFAYLTVTCNTGIYSKHEFGFGEIVIMYPACVLTFVSSHINLFYIQSYEKDRNVEYEEKFLVPLHTDCSLKENMLISVTDRMIGYGRQSVVYLANVEKRLRMQLACKKHRRTSFFGLTGLNSLETEIKILKSNNHINVLSIISLFEKDHNTYTLSPLYLGGTLQQRIDKLAPLPEQDTICIYYQLSSGLMYLHERGIIHCDLKPDNILLSSRESKPRVVISDFGLSIFNQPENIWPENYGTYAYHAPEILKHEPFTKKVDNWALGIILFQMLANVHPFMDKSPLEPEFKEYLDDAILNKVPDFGLLQADTSKEAKETISHLLDKNPEERWSTSNDSITEWVVKLCDKRFFPELCNARKSFSNERSLWFCNTGVKEEVSEATYLPDTDEKEVSRIFKRARVSSKDPDSLLKSEFKYHFTTPDDILAIDEELYPDRTLRKKRLLDVMGDTDDSINSDNNSNSGSDK